MLFAGCAEITGAVLIFNGTAVLVVAVHGAALPFEYHIIHDNILGENKDVENSPEVPFATISCKSLFCDHTLPRPDEVDV